MLSKIKDLESQRQVSPSLISKIMLLKLGSKALTESVSLPRARVHILWNESYQVSLAFQKPDCEIKSIPCQNREWIFHLQRIYNKILMTQCTRTSFKMIWLVSFFFPQETCHPPCSAKIWLVAISHSSLYKEKNYQLYPKTGGSEPASTHVINVNKC